MSVPELEFYCGSWIIVSRATGKPVLETFKRSTAEAINQRAYEVLTAAQWLARFNTNLRLTVPATLIVKASLDMDDI